MTTLVLITPPSPISSTKADVPIDQTAPQEKITENVTLADQIVAKSQQPVTPYSPKSPTSPLVPEPLPPDPPIQPLIQAPRPPPYMPPSQPHIPISAPPRANLQARNILWMPTLKRKRDSEMNKEEKVIKYIRMLLAIKAMEIKGDEEGLVIVSISITYEEAISYLIWGREWL